MAETYDVTEPAVSLPMIGEGVRRYEARSKVTGAARYAADEPLSNPLFAHIVTTPVARGRITAIDAAAALELPGVHRVLTHESVRAKPDLKAGSAGGAMASSFYPLSGPVIRYAGQMVALVLAETIEGAREGARRVVVEARSETDVAASMLAPDAPASEDLESPGYEPVILGDVAAALAAADATIEARYTTPIQHHNPLELFFAASDWRDNKLIAYVPSQWVSGTRSVLATIFDLPTERVQVVSKVVGGGFGSKAYILAHVVACADAARIAGRPVKLYVARDQMFTAGVYRSSSLSRVSMGVKDGRLSALDHEHTGQTSRYDTYADNCTEQTTRMYGWQAARGTERLVRVDTSTPGFMRAPAEVQGMFALESAVDELAAEAGIDPIALRLASDADREPVGGLPWTSRSLAACLRRGAEMFGWADRPSEPRAMARDGWLHGWGMASAFYPTYVAGGTAEVRLGSDLSVRVSAAAHDLGTGCYTVCSQIAAAELGIPLDRIRVELGDSDLPANGFAGGSSQTASVGSAVLDACRRVQSRLIERAVTAGDVLEGADPTAITFAGARMRAGERSAAIEDVFEGVPFGIIEERGTFSPPGAAADSLRELYRTGAGGFMGFLRDDAIQASFGAQFVEVAVDPATGVVRVPRMVGAFAAGRILNIRTTRSQLMGGMIWGMGSALHEATETDDRYARFVNTDLGEYHVVVNADVPSVEVDILEEVDTRINPLGLKGVGELGVVGVNAAVANAVFHATGTRARDLPIRMENVLEASS